VETEGDRRTARLITPGLSEFVRERGAVLSIARHAIMQG
jgi:hypothetical protein